MANSARNLASTTALAGVVALTFAAVAQPVSASSAALSAPQVSAARVHLTGLSDISIQGAYEAWEYSYGSRNPSVCSLGGAPVCQNFGNPVYPTGVQGAFYYVVDNLFNNQNQGTLLDVYFQFGTGATIYAALYGAGLDTLADGLFFTPQIIQQGIVDATKGIPVVGPLTKAYLLGIWDVFNAEGELVPVESGLFGLEALGAYALDVFRGSTSLSTLFPSAAGSATAVTDSSSAAAASATPDDANALESEPVSAVTEPASAPPQTDTAAVPTPNDGDVAGVLTPTVQPSASAASETFSEPAEAISRPSRATAGARSATGDTSAPVARSATGDTSAPVSRRSARSATADKAASGRHR